MNRRDRSSGWKHAKLSGHANENLVHELLKDDAEFQGEFLERTGYASETVISSTIGGLHETSIPGVLGRKTKSKTDLKVTCKSGRRINVSIKKSLGGQVYFVSVDHFFLVFEKQFKKAIPTSVKRAMQLFWAAADDADKIIKEYADKTEDREYILQLRHHSLNATTLYNYSPALYESMLKWFKENAYEITKLSFSMGAVADPKEWSEFVWYINTLNEVEVDEIFPIEAICLRAKLVAPKETYYGSKNGGTAIQLPFGFVQWHQSRMQFHHNYEKVKALSEG